MQKDICEDFLVKLDDLIHDDLDNRIGALRVSQFKKEKQKTEEKFAEWMWDKFTKERCHAKDNS